MSIKYFDASQKLENNLFSISTYFPHLGLIVCPDSPESEKRTRRSVKKEASFTKTLCQQMVRMWKFTQSDQIMRTPKHAKARPLTEKLKETRMVKKSDIQLYFLPKKKLLLVKFVSRSRHWDKPIARSFTLVSPEFHSSFISNKSKLYAVLICFGPMAKVMYVMLMDFPSLKIPKNTMTIVPKFWVILSCENLVSWLHFGLVLTPVIQCPFRQWSLCPRNIPRWNSDVL